MSDHILPPRRRYAGIALALALGLFLAWSWLTIPSLAQTDVPATQDQSTFTQADGLLANGVTALWRDDDSLWVGTTAGLNRIVLEGDEPGLAWQALTADDGLAEDAVADLWQDEQGGLWVYHPSRHLSHYDGETWTVYSDTEELAEDHYKMLDDLGTSSPFWVLGAGRRIWLVQNGVLYNFTNGVGRPYLTDPQAPRAPLVHVWPGETGVWVTAENGQVAWYNGANWTTYANVYAAVQGAYEEIVDARIDGPVWQIDRQGNVWTRNPIYNPNSRLDVQADVRVYDGTQWTNYTSRNGLALGFVAEMRLDSSGRLWARHLSDPAGEGGGLSLFDGETWQTLSAPLTNNVTDFWPEGRDGVWIASAYTPPEGGVTVGGLSYARLNAWERFDLETLEGDAVSVTWLDEDDTLWVGLRAAPRSGNTGGLWSYQRGRWRQTDGLTRIDVNDLWGDGDGGLWVATPDGVNRISLSSQALISYSMPGGADLLDGDAAGNLWTLTLGQADQEGRVRSWDGEEWTRHTVSDGLSAGVYVDMLALPQGEVYVASSQGLNIWQDDEWSVFAQLPGRDVEQIWQDQSGDLWVSTVISPERPFNLSYYHRGRWQTLLGEKSSRPMGSVVLSLLADQAGQVWLGTDLGLYVYRDERWQGIGPIQGIPRGSVSSLYEDEAGTLWAAVGDTAYRGDGWDWRPFAPGVGPIQQISQGPDDTVLFVGETGLALYEPALPALRLDRAVNLFTGVTVTGTEPLVLTVDRAVFQVDLTALAPELSPRDLVYRYRLDGHEPDWQALPGTLAESNGKRATIRYAGLPAGDYTLVATVRNSALDYGEMLRQEIHVLSRPPQLALERIEVAGEPVEETGSFQVWAGQPVAFELAVEGDSGSSVSYQYRIEGITSTWQVTMSSLISFTPTVVGTYTFTARALDQEGQPSRPVGAHMIVQEWQEPEAEGEGGLSLVTIGIGAAVLVVVIVLAILVARRIMRRRRESW